MALVVLSLLWCSVLLLFLWVAQLLLMHMLAVAAAVFLFCAAAVAALIEHKYLKARAVATAAVIQVFFLLRISDLNLWSSRQQDRVRVHFEGASSEILERRSSMQME